jgi:hypothetical protein
VFIGKLATAYSCKGADLFAGYCRTEQTEPGALLPHHHHGTNWYGWQGIIAPEVLATTSHHHRKAYPEPQLRLCLGHVRQLCLPRAQLLHDQSTSLPSNTDQTTSAITSAGQA